MESCCNASKSSHSAWIPVENGRPVAGHFTTTTPMALPSVRIHPNATSVPLLPLGRQHFELRERGVCSSPHLPGQALARRLLFPIRPHVDLVPPAATQ